MPAGLRARLVITFTGVAVISSVLVASIGFELAKNALIKRTEDSSIELMTRQLQKIEFPIGKLHEGESDATDLDLQHLADQLDTPGSHVILTYGRNLYSDSEHVMTEHDLPSELRGRAGGGFVTQRRVIRNELWLIVGTEVSRTNETGSLVEGTGLRAFMFVPLKHDELQLAFLRQALLQAGGITLLIALAVALASARRVLLPVRRLSAAAQALGGGRLDTRLPVHGQDELAELTVRFNDAAAALETSVAELRALEAMSRRFVADVSHELRTPLTAMTAVADMLSEEADRLPDEPAEAVRLVLHEVARLRELVEHLIEVSRFDAGTATLSLEPVNVADAIADALDMRGWGDGVRVNTPQSLTFNLDPRRFDVIVSNLVGNALKHGAPPVLITARSTDNGLEVKVRDHGKGIPLSAMPHVFDRFYKVGAGRARSQGSGLGLAIARANANLHGGTISVRAQQPGTLFTVWFPPA
ncbi:sensor histidine kinase [Nonomuraea soli]|uniref:histidine kinase n=1 Tax=Nonomuraea soli TaxID=1032476 RepID=A0A7W0CR16_9ACTN|nr:HAMP domain-containing sensor histidine kinase [Nonomuraea soli]MBA2895667.1 two-component system sensor histidine kinase MtrB [Nonomuraea soli]